MPMLVSLTSATPNERSCCLSHNHCCLQSSQIMACLYRHSTNHIREPQRSQSRQRHSLPGMLAARRKRPFYGRFCRVRLRSPACDTCMQTTARVLRDMQGQVHAGQWLTVNTAGHRTDSLSARGGLVMDPGKKLH